MRMHKIVSLILAATFTLSSINADISVVHATEEITESVSETEESTEDLESEKESESEEESLTEIESETETISETETSTEIETEIESSSEDELIEVQGTLEIYQAGSFKVVNEDNNISLYSSASTSKAEKVILEGLKKKLETIDVSGCNINVNDIASVMSGLVNEHPELYYISNGYSASYYPSTNYAAIITPTYLSVDGATDEAFNEAVNKALSVVDDDMSDMEKAITLHDYLALNCEYDEERLTDKTIPDISYTAYGALVENIAVCQGYALAYKYLCKLENIDCYMVTSSAINHAWNLIELNGSYYQIDTTWDDPTNDVLGRVTHNFMFVSDEAFAKSRAGEKYPHQQWKVTYGSDVVDYKATDTTYDNYFWTNCDNQILAVDDVYYYADSNLDKGSYWVKKYDPKSNIYENIASLETWSTWKKSGYWNGVYTGVYKIGEYICYNTKDEIRSVPIEGGNYTTVYTLDTNTSNGYIYNSFLSVDSIGYLIIQDPNNLSDSGNKLQTISTKDLNIPIPVKNVTLDKSEISLKIGNTETLTASISPNNATDTDITWESSNTSVATVNNGVVKGINEGTCTITATVGGKEARCTVTVNGTLKTPSINIPTGTYAIRESDFTIDKGTEVTITSENGASIYYTTDGTTPNSSSMLYLDAITIDKDMTINAIAIKSGYDDSEVATVKFIACEKNFEISSSKITIKEGESQELKATTLPTLSSESDVNWEITNGTNLISYEDGKVTATTGDDGTATITASVNDHKGNTITVKCEVTVEPLEYIVTFYYGDNNNTAKAERIKARRNATPPSDSVISRVGYTFTGWSGNYTNINQNEKVTAQYEAINYTITYNNLEGSTNDESNPTLYNIESEDIILKNPSEREGYCFDGWYTDAAFTEDSIASIPKGSSCDVVLYAKWQKLEENSGFWVSSIPDQQYTGSAIKPEVKVYSGSELLKENVDYTITYKNNTKACEDLTSKTAPTVTIKGKGNYTGTITKTFKILPLNISEASVDNVVVKATGKAQKPNVALYYNGNTLRKNSDYKISYLDNGKEVTSVTSEGTYEIRITGMGNYSGYKTVSLVLEKEPILISKATVSKVSNQTYTGQEITPSVTVKSGKVTLDEGTHYSVRYENNTLPGTASVIITGMNGYSGTKRVTFKITAVSLAKAQVNGLESTLTYTGDKIKQSGYSLSLNLNGSTYTLVENKDYSVSYKNNLKAGRATITFKGINGFTGTLNKTFTINKVDVSSALVDGKKSTDKFTFEYTKGGTKPTPEITVNGTILVAGTDYTIKYTNNSRVESTATMTITGKGNYSGTLPVPFNVTTKKLSSITITAADKVYKNARGNYQTTIKLTDTNGKVLKLGTDYETPRYYNKETDLPIDSKATLEVGTEVIVKVKGIGNYIGDIEATYRIVKTDIKSASIKVISQKTYTGREVTLDKSELVVKVGKITLDQKDYEIIGYDNNTKVGTASVTIKGVGNYGGTKTIKFKISAAKIQ